MKRRYRLKDKKRFAAVIMLFSLAVVFAGLMVSAGAASNVEYKPIIITVEPGDTLWEIASVHAENYDPRAYIYEIKKLNHLSGDILYVGQELELPFCRN